MEEEQKVLRVSMNRIEEQHDGFREILQGMQRSIEGLKEEVIKAKGVDELKVEVDALRGVWRSRVDKLEEKFEERGARMMGGGKDIRGGLDDRDIAEQIRRYERRDNLMVMGIKEGEDAFEVLKNIGDTLGMKVEEGDIISIDRVGRGGEGKNRPIRVIFNNKDVKQKLLKLKVNLKNTVFREVYLSPDLTPKQQMLDKTLRDKLKELREGGVEGFRIKSRAIVREDRGHEIVVFAPGQEHIREGERGQEAKNGRRQEEPVPLVQNA